MTHRIIKELSVSDIQSMLREAAIVRLRDGESMPTARDILKAARAMYKGLTNDRRPA